MTENRKNAMLIFLFLAVIILLVLLLFSGARTKQVKESMTATENVSQTVVQVATDEGAATVQKKNVCTNFLETYYTVSHSKSEAAALSKCKPYLTERLYNKLQPSDETSEYSPDEIDLDFSSSISVSSVYRNTDKSDEILVRCTVKRNVNGMKSRNEYYASFNLEYDNDQWLINDYTLVSVMGD